MQQICDAWLYCNTWSGVLYCIAEENIAMPIILLAYNSLKVIIY